MCIHFSDTTKSRIHMKPAVWNISRICSTQLPQYTHIYHIPNTCAPQNTYLYTVIIQHTTRPTPIPLLPYTKSSIQGKLKIKFNFQF